MPLNWVPRRSLISASTLVYILRDFLLRHGRSLSLSAVDESSNLLVLEAGLESRLINALLEV